MPLQDHEKLLFRLKAIREHAGITVEEVNEKLHLKHKNVGDWEEGIRTPRLHSLMRWARLFNMEIVLTPLKKGKGV